MVPPPARSPETNRRAGRQRRPGTATALAAGRETVRRRDARSAPNVGIEPFNGELARHRFEAVFDGDQNTVALRVKPDSNDAPPSTATLRAYTAGGSVVDTDTVSMTGGSPWQLLSVGSSTGSPQIRRVELIEKQGSFETNFVIVDDLEAFSADPPPPPPPADHTPPSVELRRPLDGSTFDDRFGTVRVLASDDQDLLEVRGAITHRATGTAVGPIDGCGPTSIYGACPLSIDRSHGFELELDGVTGTIDVPLQGPTKLNVLMSRVIKPDAGGTHAGSPPADFVDRIAPYLAQAMPARVVASIPSPTSVLRIGAGLQTLCQVFDSSCGCALWQLDMSSSLPPSHPIYQDPGPNGERPIAVRLGVVDT